MPWFSQGGSSLVANILGLGIILNISQDVKPHLSHLPFKA
nr:FtsW/RodA/SpoVE family cell cycle protein [Neochlamydia sp. AcF84]